MSPTPQEAFCSERKNGETIPRPISGEEVVISGMSGIFPSSDNVKTFMGNLYNKVDMVTTENPRWDFNHPELPRHLGKVNGMGKFDAQFFRVHFKQACTMEPMSRKLLEHAYGAIYDSGINPLQLRGKKVGVFIGSTFSESEKIVIYETIQRNGFGITGCNKSMYANRISYWIDGKGPSYALDLACASSMACLEHAYRSISTGQCEAAIVGGCNLCMHPCVSLNMKRAGFLCLDGKTKSFDKNGDGYVRSDSISVIFLQKAKDAKRIYSEVYHAKGNYATTPNEDFLPIREPEEIKQFLDAFYSEIDIQPSDVDYIEANGSGIAEADRKELEAIGQVFTKDRPIKVGSVKSNMGHSEPASGVCAVTKVCLAYEKGQLPANLHYQEPHNDVSGIRNGKVAVLKDHAEFNRGFVALNSFSYSGANIHVLLKGRYKQKDASIYKTAMPHLVLLSGRQESCVSKILNELKSQPVDPEAIGLLHNIHAHDIPGHMCRGYTILGTDENSETICLSQNVDYCPGVKRSLWFVYSGMGSQWAGMGAELMKIPIFAGAIERCCKILEPKGIDLINILTNPEKSIFDNILNSFVGIAAVQIGLTDVLREMGIEPDYIIGHSVGELGCAYADRCFTAEEMILSAYSRGLVSIQTPFIQGSMAAVGLGYNAVLPMCPEGIEVACHNSSESSTISGPADLMQEFVTKLTQQGVFAKEVPCSNIAYHSKYISQAGPGLLKYLSDVIKSPKRRSPKWVSTSVPQNEWSEPKALTSSAEYHTNNLLNPVLFEETSKLIPSNAIVIEIAPHGLLQAILKRSFSECSHVPLTRRGHADPVKFLLESVGKLYECGLNPKVSALYPQIDFPVSTGTPLLSHLVEWEHSEDWPQAKYNTKDRVYTSVREFVLSIHDDDFKYLKDYLRNDKNVFPESALLVSVWETLAMLNGVTYKDLSVVFTEIQFFGEAILKAEEPLRLCIMIHKGNKQFEVSHNKVTLLSGFIDVLKSTDPKLHDLGIGSIDQSDVTLNSRDIYKELFNKGYCFGQEFKIICSGKANLKKATIQWRNEWITFLDALIQCNVFARNNGGVSSPKLIKKLTINIDEHKHRNKTIDENILYDAVIYDEHGITRCGGIEIKEMFFNDLPKNESLPDRMTSTVFVPSFLTGEVDINTAMMINLQIIAENISKDVINVIEFNDMQENSYKEALQNAFCNISTKNFVVNEFICNHLHLDNISTEAKASIEKSDVFIARNFLTDKNINTFYNNTPKTAFILAWELNNAKTETKFPGFNIITAMTSQKHVMFLLKKVESDQAKDILYLKIKDDVKFSWVAWLKHEMQKNKIVVLVSEKQTSCGLTGLVRRLRRDYGDKVRLLIIEDTSAPKFNLESDIFKKHLKKKLVFNVLKKGQWGGYYQLPCLLSSKFENITLTSTLPGSIESLTWIQDSYFEGKNRIQVCFAGLSNLDVQRAVGKVRNDERSYGMDFSGIDENGGRVMGLIENGSIKSNIKADSQLIWPVPKYWTLEDAATVPLPYLTAFYCLYVRSQVRFGSYVFVNNGTSSLGQAVISICLALKCNIYTTVSDLKTKRFLMRLFPDLNENKIALSNDASVEVMMHGKKRCDIVINTASGSLREAMMKCTGFSGNFLDLNEDDMKENKNFGMLFLFEERSYKGVNFTNIFRDNNTMEKKKLQTLMVEGISQGYVKPITRVVYSPMDVPKAFRLVASEREKGRTILKLRNPEKDIQDLEVIPRVSFSSKSSYLIVCDEVDFSIELAERIIKRGAKNLMINLKPDSVGGYLSNKMILWRKIGMTVSLSWENLQTKKGCVNLLAEVVKLGPVQGIFVTQMACSGKSLHNASQKDFALRYNETALIVANLDAASRQQCDELKYFAVVTQSETDDVGSYMNTISEKICNARAECNLPATHYQIGPYNKYEHESEGNYPKLKSMPLMSVFNGFEACLEMKHHSVFSCNLAKQEKLDLSKKILDILGNINQVSNATCLEDTNISDLVLQELLSTINKNNIHVTNIDQLKKLTVFELKNLCNTSPSQGSDLKIGLGAFYTFIDEDECLATEPMVAMPTKLSNATENEEEIDPQATYLMLIPGFEGHHQIFYPICERLKVQAMTFQLGPDMTGDSIQKIAMNIMMFMKKRFELKSKFYLLGYSFGVNVALELAALMEKEGHVGIVYCLDSSPDTLRMQLDAYIGNLSDIELQNTIVEHLYKLMTGHESDELREDLKVAEDWDIKVETCVKRLRGLVNYSHQYKRSILQEAYKRIILARNYNPKFILNSQIVLMKGIGCPITELPDDYCLSKYSYLPVKVFNLETDHAKAPNDCRVSNIINKMLDDKVLEDFKKKNLCESYLADALKIL